MNQMGEELRCKVEENEKLKDRILELSQRVDALLEVYNIPNLDKAIQALKNGEFFGLVEELGYRAYAFNTNGIDLSNGEWCIFNDFGRGYELSQYGKTWWLSELE